MSDFTQCTVAYLLLIALVVWLSGCSIAWDAINIKSQRASQQGKEVPE
jgi:hypothetical protein